MRVMSRSKSVMAPRSGRSSPVMRLNSVVLPAPLGPMISRRSPGSTSRSTDDVTRSPPNDLSSPRTASALIARGGPRHGPPHPSTRGAPRGTRGAPRSPARSSSAREGPSRQPDRARDESLRHEDDDGDEDGAEDEVPALDVAAGHVFHDDDQRGAGDRAQQRGGAAGDHHQQRLGRGGERDGLGAHELVVVQIEDAGHAAPEAREDERQESD